jgi:hypothetical protein
MGNTMQTSISKPFLGIALLASFVGVDGAMPHPSYAKPSAQATSATPWEKAKSAINANNTKAATKYALQMLKENTDRKVWYYGNVFHEAHQILGLAALKEGRTSEAKKQLIEAGKTPGSPQIDTFGPNMVLAQQLLLKGEKQVVIEYLDLVAKFWAYTSPEDLKNIEKRHPGSAAGFTRMNQEHQRQINAWKAQIRVGKTPELNMSNSLF